LLKQGAGAVCDDDSGKHVLGPHGPHGTTDAEVVEASRAANAHHFIAGLPEGYET
jgi:ABC-type multidrug transport system fused ATPase/permease subunit